MAPPSSTWPTVAGTNATLTTPRSITPTSSWLAERSMWAFIGSVWLWLFPGLPWCGNEIGTHRASMECTDVSAYSGLCMLSLRTSELGGFKEFTQQLTSLPQYNVYVHHSTYVCIFTRTHAHTHTHTHTQSNPLLWNHNDCSFAISMATPVACRPGKTNSSSCILSQSIGTYNFNPLAHNITVRLNFIASTSF